jgi:hypothetical protein
MKAIRAPFHTSQQLVQLERHDTRLAVLRVLDQEHHQERNDVGAGVDDQLQVSE